jgi:hypothetical protein
LQKWFLKSWPVEADDDFIRNADFSLTSACPINGLVAARSALLPQAGQTVVGEYRRTSKKEDFFCCSSKTHGA